MKNKFKLIPLGLLILIIAFFTIKYLMPNSVLEVNNKKYVTSKLNLDDNDIAQENKASAMVNMDTNQILHQNNEDKPFPVYSVSKVMFLATTNEKMIKDGISFDKKVRVLKGIDKVNQNADFSKANLKSGDVYTIRELFDAVMIPSGNDAAILLAYEVFGSHQNAVDAMNENAKKWKMKNSSFISTSGLDGKYLNEVGIKANDGKNMMSVNDNVVLLSRVIKDYPIIIESGSKKVSEIGIHNKKLNKLENVNEIIEGLGHSHINVYGLKTGSNIERHSNCIVALRKDSNDNTIASISLGSKTRAQLYNDVKAMYNYADQLKVINMQDHIELNTSIASADKQPDFTLDKPYYIYIKDNQLPQIKIVDFSSKYNKSLNKYYSVNKGDNLGKVVFKDEKQFFNRKANNAPKITIKEDYNEKNLFLKAIEFLKDLIEK